MEPFADHTVYLAVYPGTHTPPSAELFGFEDATGVITSKGEAWESRTAFSKKRFWVLPTGFFQPDY